MEAKKVKITVPKCVPPKANQMMTLDPGIVEKTYALEYRSMSKEEAFKRLKELVDKEEKILMEYSRLKELVDKEMEYS